MTNVVVDQFVTVFCQGNTTARSQAVKYCASVGYIKSGDGDDAKEVARHAKGQEGPLVNIYPWHDLEDVGYGWTWWPLYALSFIKSVLSLWWFSIIGASYTYVKYDLVNVAGPRDVQQYLKAVKQCINDEPHKKLVLFGCSRGASTVLCALRHLTTTEQKHVALVMVEAPFDALDHVFKCWYGVRWGLRILKLFQYFTAFRLEQESPLQAVKHVNFPLQLPLAFVISEADRTVPIECTMELINALIERQHGHLHLLALHGSHHSEMSVGNERQDYIQFAKEMHERVSIVRQ